MTLDQLFLQLGICGAMLLVWFRIEGRRMEIAAKAEEGRLAADVRKTEAMEEGFRSLANMIADHAQADTKSHGQMGERLAAVETTLSIRVKTPPRGVTTETVRRTDGR